MSILKETKVSELEDSNPNSAQYTPLHNEILKDSKQEESSQIQCSSQDTRDQIPLPDMMEEEDKSSEVKDLKGDNPGAAQTSPFSSWLEKREKKGKLPYYPRAAQKGVKIFSAHELGNRKGLEKLRRSFWNTKAEELCKDGTYSKWSVKEIHGVIDTSWTLKKTALLCNEAERVEAAGAESDKKLKQHKSTVNHNVNRMLNSHKQILALDAALKELKSSSKNPSSKKIDKVEKRMTAEMTELKTAQESLRKSIEVKKKQLGITDTYQYEQQSIDTSVLTKEDIEAMVNDIIVDCNAASDAN